MPEEPDEGEQFTPDELSAIEEKPEEAVPEEQLPVEIKSALAGAEIIQTAY